MKAPRQDADVHFFQIINKQSSVPSSQAPYHLLKYHLIDIHLMTYTIDNQPLDNDVNLPLTFQGLDILALLEIATVVIIAGKMDRNPSLRSEEHTSELQSRFDLVCRLLLEKKK